MACSNALLIRYRIRILPGDCSADNDPNMPPIPNPPANVIPNITRVTGISLGEEGEIEVPEWDRKARISDGKRTLPTLGMQLRVDGELPPGSETLHFFARWFNFRHNTRFDILVDITRRDFSVMYTYQYVACEIRSFKQEDQELGATKIGLVDMDFAPYDVQLLDKNGAPVVSTVNPVP